MFTGIEFGFGTTATIVTFGIGLLAGIVVKRMLKTSLAIGALGALLALTGYVGVHFSDIAHVKSFLLALSASPQVLSLASLIVVVLPITSATFLVGAALGFWKG